VFLHELRPGPASRSYGLQVARLAGLPAPVVRKAGLLLEQLEARAREHDDQLDLFAQVNESTDDAGEPDPTLSAPELPDADHATGDALVAALRAIDPDALNPRQALDALYALHAMLNDEAQR
jgi:DNA mismatch repair protein MutS